MKTAFLFVMSRRPLTLSEHKFSALKLKSDMSNLLMPKNFFANIQERERERKKKEYLQTIILNHKYHIP